jgi:hypothetical protein
MMMFYYNQGIPDEPYYISPGKEGQIVEVAKELLDFGIEAVEKIKKLCN